MQSRLNSWVTPSPRTGSKHPPGSPKPFKTSLRLGARAILSTVCESHFAALIANITPFKWTNEQQAAFIQLKRAVCSTPVLRIFDPDLIAIVDADASGFAIGAVLLQMDRQGNRHPIELTSRKLQSAERNYPTHEQELLAVIHALRTWRYYLDGTKFTVSTDHATLRKKSAG